MPGLPYKGQYVPWGCRQNTDSVRTGRYKVGGAVQTINSGYTFVATVHESEDDLTVIETYSTTFPSATTFQIALTDTETGALTGGSHWWTFEVTVGGITTPICYGPYEVATWP